MKDGIVKIINLLLTKEVFAAFSGALIGAFVSYILYKRGENWRDKKEWAKIVNKEHCYLERYFNDLYTMCDKNIATYRYIIGKFQEQKTGFSVLRPFPIREDITMRLKDIIFVNRIYGFMSDVVTLDYDMKSFNDLVKTINDMVKRYTDDYIIGSGDEDKKRRYSEFISSNVELIIIQSMPIEKALEMLREKIIEIAAENRLLISVNKKIVSRAVFYVKQKISDNYRNEEIKKEILVFKKELKDSYEQSRNELLEAGVIG